VTGRGVRGAVVGTKPTFFSGSMRTITTITANLLPTLDKRQYQQKNSENSRLRNT
jgi:hypothetical protein